MHSGDYLLSSNIPPKAELGRLNLVAESLLLPLFLLSCPGST